MHELSFKRCKYFLGSNIGNGLHTGLTFNRISSNMVFLPGASLIGQVITDFKLTVLMHSRKCPPYYFQLVEA